MISLSKEKGVDLEQINQKFDEFASEHHLKIKNRDLMTYANFGVKSQKGHRFHRLSS